MCNSSHSSQALLCPYTSRVILQCISLQPVCHSTCNRLPVCRLHHSNDTVWLVMSFLWPYARVGVRMPWSAAAGDVLQHQAAAVPHRPGLLLQGHHQPARRRWCAPGFPLSKGHLVQCTPGLSTQFTETRLLPQMSFLVRCFAKSIKGNVLLMHFANPLGHPW